MDLKLINKIAVIAGASRGLGFETARVLSEEGAKVVINSRKADRINKSADAIKQLTNNPVIGTAGDLTDHTAASKLIETAVNNFGGLDILITNAGGPPSGSFENFSDSEWQNAIELSFLSHVRLIRAALPYLRKSSNPSVLTITSFSVKQPLPDLILSNSIRSATVALTKSLALELGGDGIRFNSILPGWTKTDRVNELLEYRASINNSSVAEEYALQSAQSPFNRMATPEEFANAAAFLVSPVCSYLTGAIISIDGGMYKGLL